jgi:asparagine synthase (glutamine-hydrolysing)
MALVWDKDQPFASSKARELCSILAAKSSTWDCVLAQEGLTVFCAGIRPGVNMSYLLAGNQGVVVGKLFSRKGGVLTTPVSNIDDVEASLILDTDGRRLVKEYWGRYVAFLRHPSASAVRIVRDPTGTLPCFSTQIEGLHLCFSWAEDLLKLGITGLTFNWQYIAAHMVSFALECEETAIRELGQVLPGECLKVNGSTIDREIYWDAKDFVASPLTDDLERAASMLRDTVQGCVQAWASCYGGILLRLSGGLDSSIVASCLPRKSHEAVVTCVNY